MFISFEGIDGCGKTTQAELLSQYLKSKGWTSFLTQEPSTLRDEVLKDYTLEGRCLLFLADRLMHCMNVIKPALSQNDYVICDRFVDSTIAYQVYGFGLENVIPWLDVSALGLVPDITFWLDIEPGLARSRLSPFKLDFFEAQGEDFFSRVVQGYRDLYANNPNRIIRIDANLTTFEIFNLVKLALSV